MSSTVGPKTRLAAAIVAVVLVGGGWLYSKSGSSGTPKVEPTISVAQASSAVAAMGTTAALPDPVTTDAAYLDEMEPIFPDARPAALVANAKAVCGGFDAGMTWIGELKVYLDDGVSAHDAGFALGASVAAYCPQYNSLAPTP